MRLTNIWRILLSLLMSNMSVHAMENRTEFKIDFRVNVVRIEQDFSDNASKIEEIVSYIRNLCADSTLTITSVTFSGTASPEGPYEWNRYLAGARLASLERFIRDKVDIPDSIISHDHSYIPWDYLREQLVNSDHPYKNTVISIIDNQPELVTDPDNGKLVDRRIVRLKQLDNRAVWNHLLKSYFSKMRNAAAIIISYKEDKTRISLVPVADPSTTQLTASPPPVAPNHLHITRQQERREHKFIPMAISTNLLYDALAVPNLGIEFYLGKNYSVKANWMYAWWSRDNRHRYWRAYGGDLDVRRWFGGTRPLTGHHIGIYGQMLTYDFEFGGKGYQGGKWTWGAGLSYGYSLPVSRHFNIDFTIGLGYLGGEYKKYHPADGCYVWDSTHSLNWFGPTKAEVSFVWYIGPQKKGGAR